jgi:hypothetical protein
MAPAQKTVLAQRWLKANWGSDYIDPKEVKIVTDKIRAISVSTVERIISGHPREWLPDTMKKDIFSWWGSKPMLDRLDGIAAGVANGTYL